MTGPENYREANAILAGERCDYGCPHAGCEHEMAYLKRALVHATLALVDVAALGAVMGPEERDEWDRATGRLDDAEVTP